jgi:hypothetical protein
MEWRAFWQSVILTGVTRRFGVVALSRDEREDLFRAARPHLFTIIEHTLAMTGMVLTRECRDECAGKAAVVGAGSHSFNSSMCVLSIRFFSVCLMDSRQSFYT